LAELFERGAAFVKKIQPEDRVLLVHHNDVDGYCSAAIILAALGHIKTKNVETSVAEVDSLNDVLSKIRPGSFDKIIVVDIDAPALKNKFERTGAEILIIDHHMIRADLNSERITYINPRSVDEEIYQPASYVSYKLLSSFMRIPGKEWLAALGTVGDFGFDDCRDILDKYIHANVKDDVTRTGLWDVSKVLFGAIIVASAGIGGITPEKILEILEDAEGVEALVADRTINTASKIFEKEHEKVKKAFWKTSETKGNVIFGVIDSPFKRMGSVISTEASVGHNGKTIFLLEKRGGRFKVHARCQSSCVHLGKFMEKCCHGGGHRHAAGGSIEADEVANFKARVFRELGVE